jgi:hypothetical protein
MATLFNIPKGTYACAQWRAQEIKDRRETEWEAPEAVFPARSAAHRDRLEDLQREEELMQDEGEDDVRKSDDTKNKKKKKRRRRHHGSDPSPHRSRKRDRRPPSSDRSDGGGHKAKRRGEESKDMVWVQVPRASLAK